jgi:rare lipoprotein A
MKSLRLPRPALAATIAAAALLLAACGTVAPPAGRGPAPRSTLPPDRDGPEAHPPADLDKVPDAEPKLEPIRPGGPNKPYEVLGKRYVPITEDKPFVERGLASWYGRKFHGHSTASGEAYNMYAMTAAHPTLPIPSYVRVRNPANGREVIVRVNDRGPFHTDRIIDLSYTAALKLDLLKGVRPVEIERITYEDIRTGAWRRSGSEPGATMLAQASPDPVPTAPATVVSDTPAPAMPVSLPAVAAAAPPLAPAASSATEADVANDAGAASDPIATAAQPARAFTADARGFWVQLGAFQKQSGAMDFQRRVQSELDWLAPLLAIFKDHQVHRLQAGPYRSKADAQSAAERIRAALQLVPVIVERR